MQTPDGSGQDPGSTGDARGPATAAMAASPSDTPWARWREQMPVTRKWAYFDHAAVGPLSGPAARRVEQFTREAAAEGDTVWPRWAGRIRDCRRAAAEWIGADEDEICLVPNTTAGINLVAEGLPWRAGDNVVVPEGEFPSNLFPWLNQRSKGVEVRIVPRRDGRVVVEDLMDHVDGSTRLVAASWVGYASGYRLDVEELVAESHRRGVLVFLDAIQGLGVYPLDVSRVPVDFLAADGHKWLLGPEGAGIAMIRRDHLEQLRCTTVGWNSVRAAAQFSAASFDLRDDAVRFEGGSSNMVGHGALAASLEMFLEVRRRHGERAIGERVDTLVEQLDDRLRSAGASTRLPTEPSRRSGILTFDVPGVDPDEVRKAALDRGAVVSCRGGGVRASVHLYNNDEDLTRLVSAVRSAAAA